MSLKIVTGPSGSGKSRWIYESILSRASKETDRCYFIIVPDQFTMETQKLLCDISPSGGILNVEVLSFGRLGYRIFEELGVEDLPRLDDTGKNLILRKVAGEHEAEIPIMSKKLKRTGYIAEVKSIISEFAQYGIGASKVEELSRSDAVNGNLSAKLQALSVLYKGYSEYISGNYITIEENMDILIKSVAKSELLKDSVIVFDGFTGFTPIQEMLIKELLKAAEDVIVTLDADSKNDLFDRDKEQALFYLSAKTYASLSTMAEEAGTKVEILKEITDTPVKRFKDNEVLSHLERNLFRRRPDAYDLDPKEALRISKVKNPREEVFYVSMEIMRLIREKGYMYKDFAVVTGDLNLYSHLLSEEFKKQGIPLFTDRNAGLVLHPFMAFLTSLLKVISSDFGPVSVMSLLRSGYMPFTDEQADAFSKYITRYGIRGKKAYLRLFARGASDDRESGDDLRERAEEVRSTLIEILGPILAAKGSSREYIKALYEICLKIGAAERLTAYAEAFEAEGDPDSAKEYGQVYRAVIGLFDQIYALLDEEMDISEFTDILSAGFAELKVGMLPQGVDSVAVGDLERTRLKDIKVLFILGANDGIIPKDSSGGGILSDMERSLLTDLGGIRLKPSPREKSFEERLYLYMNMTRPSDALYISYCMNDQSGASIRPAYIIKEICSIFPSLSVREEEEINVETRSAAKEELSKLLREYVSGIFGADDRRFGRMTALFKALEGEDTDKIADAAFFRYVNTPLSHKIVKKLYGDMVHTSVSRLEQFYKCAYAHFINYGLKLGENKEYSFEATDLGTFFHSILFEYGNYLKEKGIKWSEVSEEERDAFIEDAVERASGAYGDGVLYDSLRNMALKDRIKSILKRSVSMLSEHLSKGVFEPEVYEADFTTGKVTKVHGKIDRMDVAEFNNKRYVKVLDYKSSEQKFSASKLFYGVSMQLIVYLNAACEHEAKDGKEAVPSALFYYQVQDPMIKAPLSMTEDEVQSQFYDKMKVHGLIRKDIDVVRLLDKEMEKSSDVINVTLKKDGGFSAKSSETVDPEIFDMLGEFAIKKTDEAGERIQSGDIEAAPFYVSKDDNSCLYCAYKAICGFDEGIEGYRKNKASISDTDAYEAIAQAMSSGDDDNGV